MSQQIWHAKGPPLLNSYEHRGQVHTCTPLPVNVTSPYEHENTSGTINRQQINKNNTSLWSFSRFICRISISFFLKNYISQPLIHPSKNATQLNGLIDICPVVFEEETQNVMNDEQYTFKNVSECLSNGILGLESQLSRTKSYKKVVTTPLLNVRQYV